MRASAVAALLAASSMSSRSTTKPRAAMTKPKPQSGAITARTFGTPSLGYQGGTLVES